MQTIVCERPGVLTREQRAMPVPAPGEVLVRIRRIGVCGTDLHIFDGSQPYLSYPRVMGHELSGIVVAVPDGSRLAVSDMVFIVPYVSCGACHACRRGRTNCCARLQVLGVHRDGGMAEYVSVPESLVHLATGVTLDQAAMVEFLAIGAHAVRRAAVSADDRVLVVGAGPIGLATALFAAERGAQVTVLDPRRDRLDFARTHVPGARTVALGDSDEAELSALTDGDFFDAVFDATGSPAAMERGLRFVAHGGSYVLVSVVSARLGFEHPEFHKRETTLLGSRNATREDFETVLAAIAAGRIPSEALVTHRMTLDQVPDQFGPLSDPASGVVKALIEVP